MFAFRQGVRDFGTKNCSRMVRKFTSGSVDIRTQRAVNRETESPQPGKSRNRLGMTSYLALYQLAHISLESIEEAWKRQQIGSQAWALRSRLLRVDYIPDETNEEELKELFSTYGKVKKVQIGMFPVFA